MVTKDVSQTKLWHNDKITLLIVYVEDIVVTSNEYLGNEFERIQGYNGSQELNLPGQEMVL